MKSKYSMTMVSVGKESEAKNIAKALVEQKLAACVQLLPIQSTYIWQGNFECDAEILMLIKSRKDDFVAIERVVRSLHSYDVAEIISFDITAGSQLYLDWINEACR